MPRVYYVSKQQDIVTMSSTYHVVSQTIEVTPEQGQKLALAQRAGTLSLSLRTLDAAVDEPLESIRLSDILRETPLEEEIEPQRTVRVRRAAGDAENVKVQDSQIGVD